MKTRHILPAVVVLVLGLLVLAALALAGTREIPVRTYALGSPNATQVAIVRPGHPACESGVVSEGRFDEVAVFGSSIGTPGRINVAVSRQGGGHRLASGALTPSTTPEELFVPVYPLPPGGTPLTICVRSTSRSGFSLLGSAAVNPATTLSTSKGQLDFSLVLRREAGQTFIGSLPRAFSRAALWRPGWVGAWTYWALLGLVLTAFAAAAVAVAGAAHDDETRDESDPSAR